MTMGEGCPAGAAALGSRTQPLPGRGPPDKYSALDPAGASSWPDPAGSQKERPLSGFTEFSPHGSAFQ